MSRRPRSSPRWSGVGVGLAWVLVLLATVFALNALGRTELSTPPVGSFDRLGVWLDDRGTVTATFAVVRLVALVLAWYLLAVTALGLAARMLGSPSLVRLADLATIPAVRRLLGTVAGVGLSASAAALTTVPLLTHAHHRTTATPSGAADAEAPGVHGMRGEVVLRRLPAGGGVVMERVRPPHAGDGDGTATLEVVDDTATMRVVEGRATMRVEPERPAAAPAAPATWTVRAGDHFWAVAAHVLGQSWGRSPSEAEVGPYWRLLVEHNRQRLVDPANPDLVYVGQVFELPPTPPAP